MLSRWRVRTCRKNPSASAHCPRLRAIFPRLWRAAPLAGSMRRTCRKASSYVPVDMGAMLQRGFSGGFCGEDSESKGIPPWQRGSPFMRC